MGRGIDFGLSMFDFTSRSISETRRQFFVTPEKLPITGDGERFSLFDARKTSCFRAERIRISGKAEIPYNSMRVVIVTAGNGRILFDGGSMELRQYDRILVPANQKRDLFCGEMELLTVLPPAP